MSERKNDLSISVAWLYNSVVCLFNLLESQNLLSRQNRVDKHQDVIKQVAQSSLIHYLKLAFLAFKDPQIPLKVQIFYDFFKLSVRNLAFQNDLLARNSTIPSALDKLNNLVDLSASFTELYLKRRLSVKLSS